MGVKPLIFFPGVVIFFSRAYPDIIRAGTTWQTKLAGLEMKKNDVVRIPNAILFCCYVSLSDDKIATVLGRI